MCHSKPNNSKNTYLFYCQTWDIKINNIDPLDFVQRFGSRLKLKQTTITMANEIIADSRVRRIFSGVQPKTIVATALYIASKMNEDYRTQREFTNATGVIEDTIRRRTKELLFHINFV